METANSTNQNSKQVHVTGAKGGKTRASKQGTIGFSFTSYLLRKWCEFLSTHDGVVMQKTSYLVTEVECFFLCLEI